MYLKILAHPVFVNLNFHMPMVVDLSHPVIMLTGENGSGKSTLLHSIYYAMRGEQVDGYIYRLDKHLTRQCIEQRSEVGRALNKLQAVRQQNSQLALMAKPAPIRKGGFLGWLQKR